MYGIDINFLNDRVDRPSAAIVPLKKSRGSSGSKTPMLVGVGIAIAAFAGVGGSWFIFQNQQKGLISENAALDSQLSELQQKLDQVDIIVQQTQAVETEIQALASVFERIRPWSAIVRDLQSRTPNRTQISALTQTTPEEGPEATVTSVAGGLSIQGNACSFDDVNDFMLTLKNSPFLEGSTVEITTAALGGEVEGRCPGEVENGIPLALVNYTITGDIKSIPATALLDELNRQQESTGLAARIRALQATGAIE
ncbi:MAG: type IV pilus assembly protein PilN [Phormidesmis priestleyi Ana]|uniref:Type IV pilus assembly protein PilN n=1 Tax=Phormidesmis priestleyi Ana TaxID=1666911 RepID=A0A0P8BU63_9CYAN|nr:MAG: type IV pilus assembly protein PilN [Phormidesmis priestleyi Ana]